jgi:hypothetical protein
LNQGFFPIFISCSRTSRGRRRSSQQSCLPITTCFSKNDHGEPWVVRPTPSGPRRRVPGAFSPPSAHAFRPLPEARQTCEAIFSAPDGQTGRKPPWNADQKIRPSPVDPEFQVPPSSTTPFCDQRKVPRPRGVPSSTARRELHPSRELDPGATASCPPRGSAERSHHPAHPERDDRTQLDTELAVDTHTEARARVYLSGRGHWTGTRLVDGDTTTATGPARTLVVSPTSAPSVPGCRYVCPRAYHPSENPSGSNHTSRCVTW